MNVSANQKNDRQQNGKRMEGSDDEREHEDDDIDHFLLPGDENFEADRPTEHQESGDEEQMKTNKEAWKECNLPADNSDSEDDFAVSQGGRKKQGQSKATGRRVLVDSDDNSDGESSEEEHEF